MLEWLEVRLDVLYRYKLMFYITILVSQYQWHYQNVTVCYHYCIQVQSRLLTFEYKWCSQLSMSLSHRLRDPILYLSLIHI